MTKKIIDLNNKQLTVPGRVKEVGTLTFTKVELGAGFQDPVAFADGLRELGADIPEGASAWATSHEPGFKPLEDSSEVRVAGESVEELQARIAPESLVTMQERGGTWFAYRNEDLGHPECGHLQFLSCGPGCSHEIPPEQMPDTPTGLGWRYRLVSTTPVVGGA